MRYSLNNSVPTVEQRYKTNYTFKYFPAQVKVDENTYGAKIKMRGGTYFHWKGKKKSYTIKFNNYFNKTKKLLFYLPEKRAYTGEYVMNRMATVDGAASVKVGLWLFNNQR